MYTEGQSNEDILIMFPLVLQSVKLDIVAIAPVPRVTEVLDLAEAPHEIAKPLENDICPVFCITMLVPSGILTMSSPPLEQLTVAAKPDSTCLVPVLDMDVSQLPIIAATARVKAIINTPAKRGLIPFMFMILV